MMIDDIPVKPIIGTKCAICNNEKDIIMDHHHKLGIFRGYLCNPCNRSIGMLGENIENIINVVNYLNKFDKKTLIFDKTTYNLSIENDLSIDNIKYILNLFN